MYIYILKAMCTYANGKRGLQMTSCRSIICNLDLSDKIKLDLFPSCFVDTAA